MRQFTRKLAAAVALCAAISAQTNAQPATSIHSDVPPVLADADASAIRDGARRAAITLSVDGRLSIRALGADNPSSGTSKSLQIPRVGTDQDAYVSTDFVTPGARNASITQGPDGRLVVDVRRD